MNCIIGKLLKTIYSEMVNVSSIKYSQLNFGCKLLLMLLEGDNRVCWTENADRFYFTALWLCERGSVSDESVGVSVPH